MKSLITPDPLTPRAGDSLILNDATYTFTPHPLLPAATGEPYAMEGAEAVVYQLRRAADGALFALKALKPAYRGPRAIAVTQALNRLADDAAHDATPGFAVARRVCLTRDAHPDALTRWPSLEYAALMPWVMGRSWASLLLDRHASQSYSPTQARALGATLATALCWLEALHGAHTDLAGDNLILTDDTTSGRGIELLDLEGVYLPGLPRPHHTSQGTAGYQPRFVAPTARNASRRGWRRWRATTPGDLWRPEGDRFAAAILLTELLVWADPAVRAATPVAAESLFQSGELGQTARNDLPPASDKLGAVRAALGSIHPPLLALFDRVWAARSLRECPAVGEWALMLTQMRQM